MKARFAKNANFVALQLAASILYFNRFVQRELWAKKSVQIEGE